MGCVGGGVLCVCVCGGCVCVYVRVGCVWVGVWRVCERDVCVCVEGVGVQQNYCTS